MLEILAEQNYIWIQDNDCKQKITNTKITFSYMEYTMGPHTEIGGWDSPSGREVPIQ